MSAQLLPDGFSDLEPYARLNTAQSSAERDTLRGALPGPKRAEFHDRFLPRLGEVLDRLDATPLNSHDDQEANLMRLTLLFAHIAQAQEVQARDEEKHARSRKRLPITRAPADF